ncbi:PREDICTED: transcription factor BIM1-like isoform X2 [Tarenaya hassleriana]|uniref:transcription factor BIM1-like isoform X2 n=1 Tax=Tarenaya hassleriana TaxID=28532 RepID=UPI00053C620C|nr:PREDICTED: transcription factor BIM1-like isoform X2 [Tarenaya hassleriana]
MELPQPRPFETEGRKPTHDFLSLCSHSTVPPDPRTSSQGGHLKTHDFLQPLERVGRSGTKEETSSSIQTLASEKPPPPAPPPSSVDQHVLPGVFTVAQASGSERNTDENSNCSSYAPGGFTLWEESARKKGQTRKENVGERASMLDAASAGQWPGPERQSQSSTTTNNRSNFSSRSSSQVSGLKSQSFMDMIRSAKGSSQDNDGDDDEEEFIMKKESPSTSQKVDLRVRVDGKSTGNDQKPNTPRSKHSATEQRRRSKINDRFQMLRQLIPNSDHKRDKASFLLEVIEYIQFLQEKVNKYEGCYQGWNPEPGKLMNWRNNSQHPAEGTVAFGPPKLEEKNSVIAMTQTAMDQQCPFPMSIKHSSFYAAGPTVLTGSPVSQFQTRVVSEERPKSGSSWEVVASESGKPKGEEGDLVIGGGTISISTVYSQGLMKRLKEALKSSGVDMSKASISVQIELAKQRPAPSTLMDEEVGGKRPRTETGEEEGHSNRNRKKLRPDRI